MKMTMGWIDSGYLGAGSGGLTTDEHGVGVVDAAAVAGLVSGGTPAETWMDSGVGPSPEAYPMQQQVMSPYQQSLTSQYSPATPNIDQPPLFLAATSDGMGTYSNAWYGDMEHQVAPFSLFSDALGDLGVPGLVQQQHLQNMHQQIPMSKPAPSSAPMFSTPADAEPVQEAEQMATTTTTAAAHETMYPTTEVPWSDKLPNDSGVETEDEAHDDSPPQTAAASTPATSTTMTAAAPTPAPAPTPTPVAAPTSKPAAARSPKRNPRQLRTASRVPKRRKPGASPSPPPPGPPALVQARAAHNKVEQQYRKRLNQYFERLLAVLPSTTAEDGTEDDGGAVAAPEERRTSKAEVLEQARKRIMDLEKQVVALEREKKALRGRMGAR